MTLVYDDDGTGAKLDCHECGQAVFLTLRGDRAFWADCKGGCDEQLVRAGVDEADVLAQLRALDAAPITAASSGSSPTGRAVLLTPAAGIRPEPVRWLWDGRVPLGTVSLLAGRPGEGKSTLTVALAAALSNGQLEGDLAGAPAATALLSYEDHAASTIVPRLIAAGADRDLVHLVRATRDGADDLVSVPGDLEAVGEAVARERVRLLVVDPLVASLSGGSVDAHRDQDVRAALSPLHQMAETNELSVICVMHLNKGMGTDSLQRISGSIGFSGAARSVLVFGRDPAADDADATRVLANPKANLAREAPSLACRVEPAEIDQDGEKIATSRLVIEGECDTHASELLAAVTPDERTELEDAVEWLEGLLSNGQWRPSSEIKTAASHSDRTMKRAAQRLGVEIRSEGFPRRTDWRLATVGTGAPGPTDAGPTLPTTQTRTAERNQTPAVAKSGQDPYGGPTGPDPGWTAEVAEAFIERAKAKFPGSHEAAA